LKGLWDELASYSDTTHGTQADQQKLMQFLMGLNETYSAIRGQILLMNPLPSVRQAYSSVSQEEKQRLLSVTQTATELGGSAAMTVRYNNQGNQNFFQDQIAHISSQQTVRLSLRMFDRKENDALTRIGIVLDQEGDDLSALTVMKWAIRFKNALNYTGTHQDIPRQECIQATIKDFLLLIRYLRCHTMMR
jgi:hypothetical protein